MSFDDQDLERLLAQGNLSGASYDRIEERVMERVLPRPRRPGSRWLRVALPAAAALGALALYFVLPSQAGYEEDGFTAKGASAAPAGAVELACSPDRPCRAGDTLVFIVDSSAVHGYLNASARRIAPEPGERIRFFPTEDGSAPRVEAGSGTVVVREGVRLSRSLGPGVYRVDVWFTEDAPSRELGSGRAASIELTVEE